MRAQLEKVEGVESCTIDYATKTARCVVEPGTDPATLPTGLRPPYSGKVAQR